MKGLLRKMVKPHPLLLEELTTLLTEAEATLNRRPLLTSYFLPSDGVAILTPGHFLIGRPLLSPPAFTDSSPKISGLKSWNLLRYLNSSELWRRWRCEYLQNLQARHKWHKPVGNIKVGDIMLLKDNSLLRRYWPLACIVSVYP